MFELSSAGIECWDVRTKRRRSKGLTNIACGVRLLVAG